MKYKQLLYVSLILFVTSCSTPYQKYSWYVFSGGYNDKQIDDNVFEISFTSNANTPTSKTKEYVLLRSAEVALANKFQYFIINNQDLKREDVQYSCKYDRYRREKCQNLSSHSITNKITCYNIKPNNKENKIYDVQSLIKKDRITENQ